MWLPRIISSTLFLTTIILTVPLSFDVGGRNCGLAYSLSLAAFYFFFSTLRLCTPNRSRVRGSIIQLIRWSQPAIVPAIFLWSLGRFSLETGNETGWVERTFSGKRPPNTSVTQWLFGPDGLVEAVTLGCWERLLRWSTPVFQLCEGFCSLLVIQTAGQVTRWLVNRSERSDSWMIGLLVFSATVISSSVYFLYRVMQFPEISNVDASLIGAAIACSVVLCIWGIGSGRGNPVESSLLFAYIVLCIYQIFTDYKPSDNSKTEAAAAAAQQSADFPPFPPIIMASYTTIMHALSTLPLTLIVSFNFVTAAFQAVTPSVLISLGYRLFVFYASTRIIPAINENGPRGLSVEPTLEDTDAANQVLAFLSWFSPCILVAVYTSLLMHHFANTMGGYSPGLTGTIGAWWSGNGRPGLDGNLWKWVNLVGTMALYAVELWLGKEEDVDGAHWKVE